MTRSFSCFRVAAICLACSALPAAGAFAANAPAEDEHPPSRAVAGLDVAPGLEATLFASEPMMLSPTNIDIDARGRVWVCEVVNYRRLNGTRPAGDRILILEDTDGDGKADKSTVFYQGREVDSAMGICVLGNRVIVSASPNIWVFTDTDGDGKADKKELLFTKTGQPQHDHSAHKFLFGPDGRLYWNFGNTGKSVHDAQGNPVVDIFGRTVVDTGKPYRGGMAFRCDLDGRNFEVLAHNFRNNYELAVDSFGGLWQSDNDDDGNRSVRINFLLEYGNYGYFDEPTGASWQTPRTNLEAEIPNRHWHQNDPGVVPNLLITGAGSPTGIIVYEGNLLPQEFRGQMIHCDAGPSIVRSYPVTPDGAGYTAKVIDVLKGTRDNWFRPSDLCVSPDGSLFVADWYDPGVGGHRMGDITRGRIYRLAPPKTAYHVPKFDISTIDGAIHALRSPNLATRYLAYTALHKAGAAAEPALAAMFHDSSENPRIRARALWLLAAISAHPSDYITSAAAEKDADLRMTALRVSREIALASGVRKLAGGSNGPQRSGHRKHKPSLGNSPEPMSVGTSDAPAGLHRPLVGDVVVATVTKLAGDPSPQVRRECAIALRNTQDPKKADLWARLAAEYDGHDRWYLAAIGIGADGDWDACLAAWMAKVGKNWQTPAGLDIVWRSRATKTPELLAEIVERPGVSAEELPRYLRAFDFLQGPDKSRALAHLAFNCSQPDSKIRARIAGEAIARVDRRDVLQNAEHLAALKAAVDAARGTPRFMDFIERFGLPGYGPDLLALAQSNPQNALGVRAVRVLLSQRADKLISAALNGPDAGRVENTILALGSSEDPRARKPLLEVVDDPKRPLELRREAARAAGRSKAGCVALLTRAEGGKLDPRLRETVSGAVYSSAAEDIQKRAAKIFPLPRSMDSRPVPPIKELVSRRGNTKKGHIVFATIGTCAKCHIINGEGKEVGPNLSEIGAKLSRPALYESIIFPSAGISHNFATYTVTLQSGNVVTGILMSRTADAIAIKGIDAITRTYATSEVEEIKEQPISLMPADLMKLMTTDDLVNVVEYLTTLKPTVRRTAGSNLGERAHADIGRQPRGDR